MDRRLTLLVAAAVVLGGCTLTIEGEGNAGPSSPPGERGATADDATIADPGAGPAAEVVRLSDGDSGWFLIDGEEVEIRLLGYNAPERFEGDGGPLSCNGRAAESALAELLADAGQVEAVGDETDRFGRRLVDLAVDGRSAVQQLVADGRGLATGDDRDGRAVMWAAADAGRGLWGDGCGDAAADGLVIDRVEPDPPGRDEEDLNGEVVELVNTGPDAIDLTGWDIRDDSASHRFDLQGVIEPGGRLTVRMGAGRSTADELFLDSSTPVWSNRGDTVLVIDPNGVVAAWYFVGR